MQWLLLPMWFYWFVHFMQGSRGKQPDNKKNIWALKNRDGDSRFCSSPPGLANSRVSGSIEGRDGCEEPVHATSRRRHNKGFNKWQLSPKQQQRLFLSNSGNNGSSPPSSSVGFFFGSTPPEGHGWAIILLLIISKLWFNINKAAKHHN